jgi:hypothetical protein
MANVIHLTGKGMSGRLVKYKILPMPEIERIEQQIGREVTKGTSVLEYSRKLNDVGRKSMIVAVTEPMSPAERKATPPAAIKWQLLDIATVEIEWNRLFTTKDTVVLRSVYDQEHSISPAELEDIMAGKVEELED